MKKLLTNYYTISIIILFIINNLLLANLNIEGILYNLLMLLAIILNIIIIIKYKQDIKHKTLALVVSIFLFIFSKDIYQATFIISNILLLILTKAAISHSIKTIIILMISYIILCPFIFIFPLIIIFNSKNDIYEDTHYYCNNNYEIYSYSAGAMDKFHYSIGKYYDFLDFNDIITISYHERNEITFEDYENFLDNNNCMLVSDKNES